MIASVSTLFAPQVPHGLLPTVRLHTMIPITLWITGFLCLLNIALALFYRKRQFREVITYYAAFAIELAIWIFALLLQLNVVGAPFHLPPGLQVSLGEIGSALAIGIGLAPATYWHRVNFSELPKRIADDARVFKDGEATVRVKGPGEWVN